MIPYGEIVIIEIWYWSIGPDATGHQDDSRAFAFRHSTEQSIDQQEMAQIVYLELALNSIVRLLVLKSGDGLACDNAIYGNIQFPDNLCGTADRLEITEVCRDKEGLYRRKPLIYFIHKRLRIALGLSNEYKACWFSFS